MEDVVYTGTSGKFLCGDVDIRTLDRRDKVPSELGHKPENDRSLLVFVSKECFITKRIELLLCLSHECVEAGFHVWYLIPNMVHENLELRKFREPSAQCLSSETCLVKGLCQVLGALLMCNSPIGRVVGKELRLALQRRVHGFIGVNILLTPIHDTNEP